MQAAPELLSAVLDNLPTDFQSEKLQQFIKERLEEITSAPVKVAVCGRTGVGKSTLINTLRGLRPPPRRRPGQAKPSSDVPHDPTQAADVGVTETTLIERPYVHPLFPSIELWDLPGCGSVNFPSDQYEDKVKLQRFDCFLIVSASRFTEDDIFLAKLIQVKYQKPFFFVRTQADTDVQSERDRAEEYGEQFDPSEVVETLRNDALEGLDLGVKPQVFVVSGQLRNVENYDFPVLRDALVNSLTKKAQRNILLLSLSSWTKQTIEDKYKVLRAQVPIFAAGSAIAALVPIPGLSIAVDLGLLVTMARHFANAFGLTETHAAAQGLMRGAASADRARVILSTVARYATTEGVMMLLKAFATQAVLEEAARFIPIVGSVIAASISFGTTLAMGYQMLDEIKHQAKAFAHEIDLQCAESVHNA